MKNLLFIGDVVGRAGCEFLSEKLGALKLAHDIDITIVNGENSAQGNGINHASADMLVRAGADVITTGNHAFRQKDAMELFEYDYTKTRSLRSSPPTTTSSSPPGPPART